jgi:2-hydroxychromene-2-carboxylate isomerase
MGNVIFLNDRRGVSGGAAGGRGRQDSASRAGELSARTPPEFFFDVSCPYSYLGAERVERLLGDVAWIPTASIELQRCWPWSDSAARSRAMSRAEARAAELKLPLVWPERFPAPAPMALRASAYATEIGAGIAFALAAARLAYCGGFDLDDPEILAEAAAASGIKLDDCLAAARDPARDGALLATACDLNRLGVRELPAVRIGERHFAGESRLAEAAAMLHGSPEARRAAPVG